MNLATMKSVATALEKQIKADASAEETGEETGGAAEKVLAPGEMPEPKATEPETVDGPDVAATEVSPKVEPEVEPSAPSTEPAATTPAPAAATKELRLKQLKDIRDEVLKTNNANIQDIVQKIGVDNIEFIVKDVSGPNAKIVTKLERDSKPIVLGINLVDSEGKKNTSDQAYLVANNKEQDIRASASDPKNGLKLFMPDQFEELFSQIVPSKGKPEAGSDVKPEDAEAPAADTTVKPPAPSAPPKAPAPSEDRWKPLSDKLTEKGIPEDVAKKVLEFFGAQTKKVKLVEDDILSEARPKGSADIEIKFTDWLKEQNFGDEINKKIIDALVEVSNETKLISKTNLGKTLTKNMGYAKPRELSGQTKSSEEPVSAVDTGMGSDEQDDEDDDEEEKSNKKKIDQWAEVKKNPAGWELTTVKGTTVKIADAITLPSGKKTYTVIKSDGTISGAINPDLIAVVTKAKAGAKPPEVPVAKPEVSTKAPIPPEPAAKVEEPAKPEITAKPEAAASVTPVPAAEKVTADEQSNEQKALKYIKQRIKSAVALNTRQITVRDLYNKTNFVDSGNITALLNKIKEDPEVKDLIAIMDPKPTGKILLKVGKKAKSSQSEKPDEGELDIGGLRLDGSEDGESLAAVTQNADSEADDEGQPAEDPAADGEDGDKVPARPAAPRRSKKSGKTTPPVSDLDAMKTKAETILKKYAKKEGKEGEDLRTFIENIKKAENKAVIIQIFDIALEEGNALKASEELNGDNSKKAEVPPTGPELETTEATPEPKMTPEKLKYGKKQVEKILKSNKVKITSEIREVLEAAEDESGLRDILFDNLEDATDAKMELSKALEDYDSKQVQKESLTRPMFVLKEGIFRLNRY